MYFFIEKETCKKWIIDNDSHHYLFKKTYTWDSIWDTPKIWYLMHERREGERGEGRREGGPGGPDTKPLLPMDIVSSSPQWRAKSSYQSIPHTNRKVGQCHWIKPEGVNDVSLNRKSQKVTKMQWTFTLTRILKIVINSWSLSTYSHTSIGWFFFFFQVNSDFRDCWDILQGCCFEGKESRGKTALIFIRWKRKYVLFKQEASSATRRIK